MRKLITILLLAFLATPAFCAPVASTSEASTRVASPGPIWLADGSNPYLEAPALNPASAPLVEVCYFGVTLKVIAKIADRLMKVGATMGACGSSGVCPPGTVAAPGPGGMVACIPPVILVTVEKPADTKDAIRLTAPQDAPARDTLVMVSYQDIELSVDPKTAARLVQRGFAAGPAQPQADEAVAGR